ncbi:MAG: hypothetical protein ABIZ36_02280, partial [Gemmatimonadaceae bacterium]
QIAFGSAIDAHAKLVVPRRFSSYVDPILRVRPDTRETQRIGGFHGTIAETDDVSHCSSVV